MKGHRSTSGYIGTVSNANTNGIFKQSTWPPKALVTTNLILQLDAGNTSSYSGTGTTWSDLSGNNNNFTLNNASAYNSTGPKYMNFGGSYGAAYTATDITLSNYVTYMVWTRVLSTTTDWRTLTRANAGSQNHHVIFEYNSYRLGMYNNSGLYTPLAYNDSGFLQTNLPNYGTSNWACLYWRFAPVSPYYQFGYNDTPGTIRGTANTTGAQYGATGFGSIGAYNANSGSPSQFWGDISMFLAYNRVLTNAELLQNFNATRSRYGI